MSYSMTIIITSLWWRPPGVKEADGGRFLQLFCKGMARNVLLWRCDLSQDRGFFYIETRCFYLYTEQHTQVICLFLYFSLSLQSIVIFIIHQPFPNVKKYFPVSQATLKNTSENNVSSLKILLIVLSLLRLPPVWWPVSQPFTRYTHFGKTWYTHFYNVLNRM